MPTDNNLLVAVPLEDIALEQNHYASHLAGVNKKTEVVSTEDVYNENGVLIVPKGVRINENIASKILRHQLEKPLEEQIQLRDSLDKNTLKIDLKKVLSTYQDLQQLHDMNDFEDQLSQIIQTFHFDPILIQKLTVLQKQFPNKYEKALFSSWLAALIASELELDKQDISTAFISGLVHDLGLLNINPETLNKKEKLTADEWRAVQSHVVIGKIILLNIPTLDPRAAEAVLDHHERCDGSGYLLGKTGDELNLLGNIIGMVDSMQAIRLKQFQPSGRNFADVSPYLKMNSHAHSLEVYKAMCHILKKSELKPSGVNPLKSSQELISHLLHRGVKLKKSLRIIDDMVTMTDELKKRRSFLRLGHVLSPVEQMIRSSGILDDEMMNWLESVEEESQTATVGELAEIELMQNELYWQLKKLEKSMLSCLDSDKKLSGMYRSQLQSYADKMAILLEN